jgi:hypothetical protein
VITGMPRLVGPLGCRSCARSRLTSFREAASRLTFKPSTSPNQPLSLASLIRSLRLAMISTSRGRAVGASRRLGHRKHECSCLQVEP